MNASEAPALDTVRTVLRGKSEQELRAGGIMIGRYRVPDKTVRVELLRRSHARSADRGARAEEILSNRPRSAAASELRTKI